MRLFTRIVRIWGQSRIRLRRAPIEADSILPGDWLQLGIETWRVASRRIEPEHLVFQLRPLFGTVGASLLAPRAGDVRWVLRRGDRTAVAPDLIQVFANEKEKSAEAQKPRLRLRMLRRLPLGLPPRLPDGPALEKPGERCCLSWASPTRRLRP